MKNKKILILGITGMLGHKLFEKLSLFKNYDVYGTVRNSYGLETWFSKKLLNRVRSDVDADNFDTVIEAIAEIKPDILINCVGIIKQLHASTDPLIAIYTNSLLPHKLANVCRLSSTKFISISTDCVFDGLKGNYTENDFSNSYDLYGRTKYLGEVYGENCITLRTSIIGHELKGKHGLVDWFLCQKNKVNGFTRAIYSGFSTVELANIIGKYVIPKEELSGLYQVSSTAISKFDLLKIIAKNYRKKINITPYNDFFADRSLDSSKFKAMTGYVSPSWNDMIKDMYDDYKKSNFYK